MTDDLRARLTAVRTEVGKAVVGQDAVVTGLVIALLVRGHVLLEGVPGVAMTLLVRALAEALVAAHAAVGDVRLTDEVAGYVVALVRATREGADLETGASPRSGAMLAAASRARAALEGRDYVIPDDVKALALPALRHRVILSPAAEIEGRRVDEAVGVLIEQVEAPR